MKKIIKIFFLILILAAIAALIFVYRKKEIAKEEKSQKNNQQISEIKEEKKDRVKCIEISDNTTYGELMKQAGVDYALAMVIYDAAKPAYDLVKIRAGRIIELVFDKDDESLKELKYKIDTEDELSVKKIVSANLNPATSSLETSSTSAENTIAWQAKVALIPYEVNIKTATGTVESSMYQAALDNNIDIRAIIDLANAFQWSIDFAMDPRKGDTFAFVYEERYLDGKYIMPGKIFAGKYINDGQAYYTYYFEENENNKGFFDEKGNSAQKMFLKAPVEFKYISSGFTTGLRYIKEFNVSTGHRAIDYAAPAGTPIRAVGDGTVIYAGWTSAGYGRLTSIRHNSTYSTNYGHQSKIIVKKGQKIKQGQTIGYVGSTGFSTGPHLHFEMVKNGVKINPLKEILPPGTPIKTENKERFFTEIKKWQEMLK